tara:strand:- start:1403 stop:1876 length:474 start_codon:yes stop_codon:yes gene_type:complete
MTKKNIKFLILKNKYLTSVLFFSKLISSMKKIILIITFICFPFQAYSSWFKLFNTNTSDLFINTNSIKKQNDRIFFSQLVNYKKQQKNKMKSLIVFSEINCSNLKTRDIYFEAYEMNMGRGKIIVKKTANKKWKSSQKGSSVYFINEILCDRVISKE